MFAHLGFSYTGLLYLMMLFIPNLVWSRKLPSGYSTKNESVVLLVFERVGQVLVTCTVLLFSSFKIQLNSDWTIWLLVSFACMLLYEVSWIRYFAGARTEENFYRSLSGIPVPLATLPVVAFLLLGIYGHAILLIFSVLILGIGHIGIHMQHLASIQERQDVVRRSTTK